MVVLEALFSGKVKCAAPFRIQGVKMKRAHRRWTVFFFLQWVWAGALTNPPIFAITGQHTVLRKQGETRVAEASLEPSQNLISDDIAALREPLRSFLAKAGGTARIQWNSEFRLPERLAGFHAAVTSSNPRQAAQNFLSAERALLLNNEEDSNLQFFRTRQAGTASHVDFQQYYQNIPVHRAIVTVHINSGQINTVHSAYRPSLSLDLTALLTDENALAVIQQDLGSGVTIQTPISSPKKVIEIANQVPVLCWRVMVHTLQPFGGWEYLVDAKTGAIVEKNRQHRDVKGSGKVYLDNSWVTPSLSNVPFYNLDGKGYLSGAFADVYSYLPTTPHLQHTAYSGTSSYTYEPVSTAYGSPSDSFSEQNVYYYINHVHDFFRTNFGYWQRDEPFTTIVHYPNSNGTAMDNAYFDPTCQCMAIGDGTGAAQGGMNDLARDAETIYHEYTHAVIDRIVPLGVQTDDFGSAMNEAYADYFACTPFKDPHIGEWIAGSSEGVRNLDNQRVYPTDVNHPATGAPEAHYTGMIWGGALWDLHNRLGNVVADQIIFHSLYYLPQNGNANFAIGYDALRDADQELYGGAHAADIQQTLNNRGIFPPTAIVVESSYLASSVSVQGTLPGLPYGTLTALQASQYTVYVPAGGRLTLLLEGTGDVDLYVRRGMPVTLEGRAYGEYDYWSNSPQALERMVLDSTSTPPLTEGLYYIGVATGSASPVNFTLTAIVSNGPSVRNAVFVPVILSTPGLNGSYYTTETTLTNHSNVNFTLQFTYLPSSPSTGSSGGAGTVTASLAAGVQWTIPDTIAYLRQEGLSIPESGTRVGILSIQPVHNNLQHLTQLRVMARTTTRTLNGQAGVAYSGIRVTEGLNGAAFLCGLRENNTDRSNLAVENLGTTADGDIRLHLTVFNGDNGASQPLPEVTLVPGEFAQISRILVSNGLNLTNGYVKVERTGGTAPFYAYAVINDQRNSDGSFISPLPVTRDVAPRLTLPVVVEVNTFSSEVMLTNCSGKNKTIQFEYSAQALTTEKHSTQFSVEIPAGRQISLPNFVQYLRHQGIPGLPLAGTTLAGPLVATSSDGDLNGIFLGARTSTPGEGGSFGVFNAAMPDNALPRAGACVYGLQQNETNRSNLGLVNLSPAGGSIGDFMIDIINGDTGAVATTFYQTLPGMSWVQMNSILADKAPGVTSCYVCVSRMDSLAPFILYGVINDGGAPGQGTGDGAFLTAIP
jgi:Zn-dependent metalloprotease